MKITMLGTKACKDCVAALALFEQEGAEVDFHDFSDSMPNLKEFLKLRDESHLFDTPRAEGKVGVPCLVCEDGFTTLDPEEALRHARTSGC